MLERWSTSSTTRNDVDFERGTFRVRGDVIEIHPAYEETALRIELFGDEVERIAEIDPLTGETTPQILASAAIYPAKHFVTQPEKLERAWRDPRGAGRAARGLPARGQAARGAAAQAAHRIRHGDAARGRHLRGDRELLAPSLGPPPGERPQLPDRLLPGRLPADRRRVARDRAAGRRDVRGRPLAQADARRVRIPPALGARQPAAPVRRVRER